MTPSAISLLWLVLLWVAYCGLHSGLASLRGKARLTAWVPGLTPRYRLAYNALAVVLLVPLLWLMEQWGGEPLWRWPGAWRWAADGLAALAGVGFLVTLRGYDMAEFLGFRPEPGGGPDGADAGPLVISPLHRWVRHPWYTLGLVIIWTRQPDAAFLATALVWSVYLVLGSKLEERRLVSAHGEAYRRYQARVPALVPRPWQGLTRAEGAELVARTGGGGPA